MTGWRWDGEPSRSLASGASGATRAGPCAPWPRPPPTPVRPAPAPPRRAGAGPPPPADPPAAGPAEAHYREALALAEELGARPLAARCHLGLGRLHRKTTQPARARGHLTTAITMLREMGMALWLDQASTELAAR